jgi:hypothetical protein
MGMKLKQCSPRAAEAVMAMDRKSLRIFVVKTLRLLADYYANYDTGVTAAIREVLAGGETSFYNSEFAERLKLMSERSDDIYQAMENSGERPEAFQVFYSQYLVFYGLSVLTSASRLTREVVDDVFYEFDHASVHFGDFAPIVEQAINTE